MKMKEIALSLMVFVATFVCLCSCGNSGSAGNAGAQTEEAGPEYTSKYICPMHCKGSGSAQSGKCPTCRMDYVVNENVSGSGDGHEGHDHGSHDGHNH